MQYLAKVHTKKSSDSTQLRLLAINATEEAWQVLTPARLITTAVEIPFNEQALILIELDDVEAVTCVQDATDWVLSFVKDYLTQGLSPQGLAEELERAEQWRQSLTLQSQEVRRRALETAARRDEIQNLEKRLKLERETLGHKE